MAHNLRQSQRIRHRKRNGTCHRTGHPRCQHGALALMALALLPDLADAAETVLEEVVVNAALIESDRRHTSVALIDRQLSEARNAQHLEDVLSAAVNVASASGASRGRFFQIRGIGERSQFVEPVNASVGLLLDGIDLTGIGGAGLLFDLAQVEILRGPQGTLFGANALAGLIHLQPSPAESATLAELSGGVEQYGGRQLGLRLGGRLSPTINGRLSGQQYRSDGYISNTFLDRDDTNGRDEGQLRLQLGWQQDDDSVSLLLQHLAIDNGYDAFSLDNTRETLSDQPGTDGLDLTAGALRWEREGDRVNRSLQLSFADTDTRYRFDEDWSFVGIAPDLEYSSVDDYRRDRRMRSLEGRIQSAQDSAGTVGAPRWVLGVFLRDEDESLRREYTYLGAPFGSDLAIATQALFGQVDIDLTDSLDAFAGVRIERRASDYQDSAAVGEAFTDRYWSGRSGLRWQMSDSHALFATLARGVRAGGVNANLLASVGAVMPGDQDSLRGLGFFDGESLHSLDVGWRWTGVAAESDLTLFYMDRRDQQARSSIALPRDDGSTAFIDFTANAARGYSRGLEWQGRWQPTDAGTLGLAVGWLDAAFDRYVTADGRDLAGRDQPQAPNWQVAINGRYRITQQISAFIEATGSDSYFFSDDHDVRSPERYLINASLTWQQGPLQIRLWGRNLGNETVFVRGFGTFGNDPRKGYALEPYFQYGEPRVLGVSATYDFAQGQ